MFDTYLKRNLNVLSKDRQKDVENIIKQKRYAHFSDRPQTSHIHIDNFLLSQGVKDCMTWRNSRLGKSIYDFALIPMMIWEIQPATILEIGSGEGASAVWMADLCKSYGLSTKVHSIDIEPPNIEHEGVTFYKGDSREINNTMLNIQWRTWPRPTLPHPWIILEDAHVEVNKVLTYFERHMHTEDYIIIEDSRGKLQTKLKVPNTLYVDAYYCDYFGLNATSAMNTILCKIASWP